MILNIGTRKPCIFDQMRLSSIGLTIEQFDTIVRELLK